MRAKVGAESESERREDKRREEEKTSDEKKRKRRREEEKRAFWRYRLSLLETFPALLITTHQTLLMLFLLCSVFPLLTFVTGQSFHKIFVLFEHENYSGLSAILIVCLLNTVEKTRKYEKCTKYDLMQSS